MEVSTRSQDFLYLNSLVHSVELAQELILFFSIRDYFKRIQPPQLNPDGHEDSSPKGTK